MGQSSGPTQNSTGSLGFQPHVQLHQDVLVLARGSCKGSDFLSESLSHSGSIPPLPAMPGTRQPPLSPSLPQNVAALCAHPIPVCKAEGMQVCAFLPSCLYKMLLPTRAL